MNVVRHKCFISYHHEDQDEVDAFVRTFGSGLYKAFTPLGLGREMSLDIINSEKTDYVMQRIRDLYLSDSTVTIVMLGKCTWARRYVDWELQSSLRSGDKTTPNGLLGIKLPSFREGHIFPERFEKNLNGTDSCYARHMPYPSDGAALVQTIDAAHARRTTHAKYIVNSRDRFFKNRQCE